MKNSSYIAAAFLLSILNANISAAQSDSYVLFAGTGMYLKPDSSNWETLDEYVVLFPGDYVKTEVGDSLLLYCHHKSKLFEIQLKEESRMELKHKCSKAPKRRRHWIRSRLGEMGLLGNWLFRNPFPPEGKGPDRTGGAEKLTIVSPRWGKNTRYTAKI